MDFYVYLHKKKTTGEVFYVGKGSGNRAWNKESRSEFWKKIANKHGYTVEIHSDNLQEWYAFELEKDLISYYGRRQLGLGPLVNLSDGGEGTGGWIPTQEFKDFRRKFMQREDAPNKDKRLWTFKNLNTQQEVITTRHNFRSAYPNVLVNTICTSSNSSYGWVVLENQTDFSINAKINGYTGVYNKSSDKNVYSVTNLATREVFEGTRQEVSNKIGTKAERLVRGKVHVSMGWVLTEKLQSESIKLDQKGANASNIDGNIYSFTNINTEEVFIGRRVDFEKSYGFSLKPLFTGNRTCQGWALTSTVAEVGFDFLREPTSGDLNINADLSKYSFKHLITMETFYGTRAEFRNKFNVDIGRLFSARKNSSANYWCLEENYEHAREISPHDLTIYTFVHSSGKIFKGTRSQMKEATGVCVKALFRQNLSCRQMVGL